MDLFGRDRAAAALTVARIHPEGWRELSATGIAQRERQTLEQFAAALPDGYSVFHGVHWTRVDVVSGAQGSTAGSAVGRTFPIFGEIDFAVVGPAGQLLLIEQKTGFLAETAQGLVKRHGERERRVAVHLARSVDALASRLAAALPGEPVQVDALLYCPDYEVREPGSAGVDPARIIDARSRDRLIPTVRALLPEADPARAARPAAALKARVERFLADVLQLVPDVNATLGEAQALYTHLSGGLAHWAQRIECEPFRLRVTGTAGSGKTQLALAVYREAVAAGRRTLFVCYNRPLADHVARLAPAGGEVATYHQLADRVARALGERPDFSRPDAFAQLEALLDRYTPQPDAQVDTLIVDEGQDFQERWAQNLLRMLAPGAAAWWLEDPLQNLYGRAPVALPGWVRLRSEVNYRTPRRILELLNRLLPLPQPVEAGSPVEGYEVDVLTYANDEELVARTVAAVARGIGLGFRRSHVAVLSYRGREHSKLAALDRLGPYRLRAPTGRYDLFGNPTLTEGEVLLDSVHRFKGQSAPCVVLTEIDFDTLDERAMRRLFVGATRATMKLTLVIAQASAARLRERWDLDG